MASIMKPRWAVNHAGRARTRRRVFPGAWTLGWQIALMLAAALAYFGVRGLTQSSLSTAQANGRALMDVERALKLDWEDELQSSLLDNDFIVNLVNWVYIYGHWPVVIGVLVFLFVRLPHRYYLLRNALFISGAIGLVIFAFVPVAPPRLGVLELVDTVSQRSSSYRALQPPGLINKYAALPSLHFGWNLLVAIVLWRSTTNRALRAFAFAMVPMMAFAVVATANHYVVDVLAGGVVALIGLALARELPSVRATPAWARTPG
jgi:PAP2 superfamily